MKLVNCTPAALGQLKKQGFRFVRRFDGPRGSGKTTKAKALCERLQADGMETRHFEHAEGDGGDVVYARKAGG